MNETTALEYINKLKNEKVFKTDKFLDKFIEDKLYKKLDENSKEGEIISVILDKYGNDALEDMLASETTKKYINSTCSLYNIFYLLMIVFAYYFMFKSNSFVIFLMNSLVAALGLQGMADIKIIKKSLREDTE